MKYDRVLVGDCRDVLATLPERSVQMVVTSPPYFGLRDYGMDGQIGAEPTPAAFVAALVEVFRGVRRVLRDDGVILLNLGDSYKASGAGKAGVPTQTNMRNKKVPYPSGGNRNKLDGFKTKDRLGIPHRVVFALQDDGWYWRDEIVWYKRNPMRSSAKDRCCGAHEMVFMITKNARYYYDHIAIQTKSAESSGWAKQRAKGVDTWKYNNTESRIKSTGQRTEASTFGELEYSNKLSVWDVPTHPYKGAHFATFPIRLITPMIMAGTSEKGCCPKCGAPVARVVESTRVATRPGADTKVNGRSRGTIGNRDPARHVTKTKTTGWAPTCDCGRDDYIPCTVLDPFMGSGTVGVAARRLGRRWLGIELNPSYAKLAERRINGTRRGFGIG